MSHRDGRGEAPWLAHAAHDFNVRKLAAIPIMHTKSTSHVCRIHLPPSTASQPRPLMGDRMNRHGSRALACMPVTDTKPRLCMHTSDRHMRAPLDACQAQQREVRGAREDEVHDGDDGRGRRAGVDELGGRVAHGRHEQLDDHHADRKELRRGAQAEEPAQLGERLDLSRHMNEDQI